MELEARKINTLPPRFADLKRSIALKDEDSQARLTAAWNDLLGELHTAVEEIKAKGSSVSDSTDV